jgi:D-tyrosyl-tRNA(Tyr) deacylase
MICLIQRVRAAAVHVGPEEVARIGPGLLLLVGVARGDAPGDAARLAERVAKLRVLEDPEGRMGRSLLDGGEALAVSQFTLLADFGKGNRPSFHLAAGADHARPLFEAFVAALAARLGRPVPTGVFGAEMRVDLSNDGPATFHLAS